MLDKVLPIYKYKFELLVNEIEQLRAGGDSFILPQKPVDRDVLFFTAVHGDEKIGVDVMRKIEQSQEIDWLIANDKALDANKRFINVDMNRAGPGNPNSEKHEERRAAEIIAKAQEFNYMVDLHGSKSDTGLFVIITKPSFVDLLLALQFKIANIVFWLPSEKRPTGPLVEFLEPAIEIEAGPKDSSSVQAELQEKIQYFLQNYTNQITKENLQGKNIFWVYGKHEKMDPKLINFEEVELDGEKFYPLLVGEYDFACYKMFKVNC